MPTMTGRTINAVVDVETTFSNKGNPFDIRNKLVVVGVMWCDSRWNKVGHDIYYDWEELKKDLKDVQTLLGFNFKFDLHWLRNIGFHYHNRVRDAQLAEFLLSNQTHVLPSLDDCAYQYLKERKFDVIKTEYWEKGIDTDQIPKELLEEYLIQDLDLTRKVYQKQEPLIKEKGLTPLLTLQCADLLVLQEMEYNGVYFLKDEARIRAEEGLGRITELRARIASYSSCPTFSPTSGDHLSCLLYGGTICDTIRVPIGVYKTGIKIGQVRNKILEVKYEQKRLVVPLDGSELKKEGYFSTDEATLLKLSSKTRDKQIQVLLASILELSKAEKLINTYYIGIPKLMEEMQWQNSTLHGQLNQCITRTGRLSSSKPNLQNFDALAKQLCVSLHNDS
jgi:DNA polymerase I-like protein with 3'-5' exonuclease and polymerase domains